MVVITGIGRSGTSFTAKVLNEAGACFKGAYFDNSIKAGMESEPMARLNNEIMFGRASTVEEAISSLGIEDFKTELEDGVFFKDPRFILTLSEWLESGYNIEHIIYCSRDYREIYQSSLASGHGMAGDPDAGIVILSYTGFVTCFSYMEKMFFRIAKQAGVPITFLYYPRSVLDFAEFEKLGSLFDLKSLKDAWLKVRKPAGLRIIGSDTSESSGLPDISNLNSAALTKAISQLEQTIASKDRAIAMYESKFIYMPWLKRMGRNIRKRFLKPVKGCLSEKHS